MRGRASLRTNTQKRKSNRVKLTRTDEGPPVSMDLRLQFRGKNDIGVVKVQTVLESSFRPEKLPSVAKDSVPQRSTNLTLLQDYRNHELKYLLYPSVSCLLVRSLKRVR